MDNDRLFVTTEDGQELEMQILFTFDSEDYGKSYVFFFNPEDENGEVGCMSYDEEGNLENIEAEEEWEMITEVFNTFMNEEEDEDEECCCGHHHHHHHHEESEECGCHEHGEKCCCHDEECECEK